MAKAVFLDRDGVIIEDSGYVGSIDRVAFLPGVSEAIKRLNENGFKVIVVTNQAGVARGYFTEEDVNEVHRYISKSLSRANATIDQFYYCPHHVEGVVPEYIRDCYDRKPNPGMIEKAVREFDINPAESYLVGDNTRDIDAGRRSGCKTILLTELSEAEDSVATNPKPDFYATDLLDATKIILSARSC